MKTKLTRKERIKKWYNKKYKWYEILLAMLVTAFVIIIINNL